MPINSKYNLKQYDYPYKYAAEGCAFWNYLQFDSFMPYDLLGIRKFPVNDYEHLP